MVVVVSLVQLDQQRQEVFSELRQDTQSWFEEHKTQTKVSLAQRADVSPQMLHDIMSEAGRTRVASVHYTERGVGLSPVERCFNRLEGKVVFQTQNKTANGDADRVLV